MDFVAFSLGSQNAAHLRGWFFYRQILYNLMQRINMFRRRSAASAENGRARII